jgi:uncharacterized membrane protein YjjP (DUF1212 family)
MDTINQNARVVGNILLDAGGMLMSSGANTNRVRITMTRIAQGLGFDIELFISHRALMLTIIEKNEQLFFSKLKRISTQKINFLVLSGISHLSWNITEKNMNLKEIQDELLRLKSLPSYPRFLVLILVSLAGSAFCNIIGGGWIEMLVTFVATSIGLFTRQWFILKKFNPYLCVFFASFAASLIAGLSELFQIGGQPDKAFATSVLFLVPGVPLINSVSDLLEGNIQNGLVRGVNGVLIFFSIAFGIFAVKMVFNFSF